MSYGEAQRYWLACAYGTSADTCQHEPKCVTLEGEYHRGDAPPFGKYWQGRLMGTGLDPAEPAMPVAAALAAYDNRPGTGPGTGLSAMIQPNELVALHRLLNAARAERAAPVPQLGARHTDEAGTAWTVRAVIPTAEDTRSWHVAAQEGDAPRWSTWYVWRQPGQDGQLIWTVPRRFATDLLTADEIRQSALEDLAERAGLADAPPF